MDSIYLAKESFDEIGKCLTSAISINPLVVL